MSAQFFSKLSRNYIELLKDDEYYDITIEVGEDPNVKLFRAHMNILYIYGGILSLNVHDISDSFKVLAAADNLHLQGLLVIKN
ncbi:hypothetical protein RhiirB3_453170 [Rhizophagus irregularis]|nr:hypothetical protein RhiirB3_453170 [Rhizophagus irregularis]